jgi:hypothetical protein
MLIIDKNVPFNRTEKTGSGVKKYPFKEMEVGDSFLITDPDLAASIRVQASVRSKLGKKFTCRSGPDGIRVHRVS